MVGGGVSFSLFPSLFIAPSTKATLWFDLILNRDLGLGNQRKSFVEYMYRPLCVHIIFLFAQRSFINSSDKKAFKTFRSILVKIWTTQTMYEIMFSPVFVWVPVFLPCPFELEVTHGADKLLFFNRKYVLFRL